MFSFQRKDFKQNQFQIYVINYVQIIREMIINDNKQQAYYQNQLIDYYIDQNQVKFITLIIIIKFDQTINWVNIKSYCLKFKVYYLNFIINLRIEVFY